MAQRMVQTRPTDQGWVDVDAGPLIWMMFHRNRRQEGRDDDIERPSVVYGETGSDQQLGRIDAFSVGGHYHILPTQGDVPEPLVLKDGQTYWGAGMEILADPNRFRELLVKAKRPDLADALPSETIFGIANQVENLHDAMAP